MPNDKLKIEIHGAKTEEEVKEIIWMIFDRLRPENFVKDVLVIVYPTTAMSIIGVKDITHEQKPFLCIASEIAPCPLSPYTEVPRLKEIVKLLKMLGMDIRVQKSDELHKA